MATLALLNCFSYVDSHDFTADTNQATLAMEAVQLDKTTFRSAGWTTLGGGLRSSTFEQSGFWQAGAGQVDPDAFTNLAVRSRVHTFGPAEAEGGTAYLWQAGHFTYSLLGTLGEMAPFSLEARGTDGVGVVRGQLAKALGDISATGALGTGLNLGNVGAAQFLYGALHVFTAGTTITVLLESDDNAGFTTATTRATFGPITTTGGSWAVRTAGPLSETHYRLRVSAITGTFSVAGAIAIQ